MSISAVGDTSSLAQILALDRTSSHHRDEHHVRHRLFVVLVVLAGEPAVEGPAPGPLRRGRHRCVHRDRLGRLLVGRVHHQLDVQRRGRARRLPPEARRSRPVEGARRRAPRWSGRTRRPGRPGGTGCRAAAARGVRDRLRRVGRLDHCHGRHDRDRLHALRPRAELRRPGQRPGRDQRLHHVRELRAEPRRRARRRHRDRLRRRHHAVGHAVRHDPPDDRVPSRPRTAGDPVTRRPVGRRAAQPSFFAAVSSSAISW